MHRSPSTLQNLDGGLNDIQCPPRQLTQLKVAFFSHTLRQGVLGKRLIITLHFTSVASLTRSISPPILAPIEGTLVSLLLYVASHCPHPCSKWCRTKGEVIGKAKTFSRDNTVLQSSAPASYKGTGEKTLKGASKNVTF